MDFWTMIGVTPRVGISFVIGMALSALAFGCVRFCRQTARPQAEGLRLKSDD
jgi:hypothetical protein